MSTTEITPRTILEESIKDIEEGRWLCGTLCQMQDLAGNKYEKPMGCALGLISLNAGAVDRAGHATYATDCVAMGEDDPDFPPWPAAGLEAMSLLAYATDTPPRDDGLHTVEARITSFNDAHGFDALTPELAKAWFERALANIE